MDSTLALLCLVFESTALMFVVLGVPLLRLKWSYSSRESRATLQHESWSSVGPAAGLDMIAIGATLAPLSLVLWLMSTGPASYALACSGWLLVGVTGILFHGVLRS